jgi:5'(3')-deoxyribonucleotidase
MMQISKIFIDMDGVLADFDLWKDAQPEITDDPSLWKAVSQISHFYGTLKPMPEAHRLMDYLQSLHIPLAILTGIPRKTSIPTAEQDKAEWMLKNFGHMEFNIGPYSQDKQNWSGPGPGLILIDDKPINIQQWEAKGGKGFLYEGFLVLYDELQAYLKGSI